MTTQLHKLDFTLTVPATLHLSDEKSSKYCYPHLDPTHPLYEKLRKVPAKNLDRLHPKESDIHPQVEYVEEGLWKSKITFQRDFSYSVLKSQIAAQTKAPYASLDALCQAEWVRRQESTQKAKSQIAYSAINRDDLISSPQVQDADLRAQLTLKDDTVLQTEHLFAKNSPLNGQSFILDGQTVHLSQAIACSSDRTVENTANLRVVQTKNKESISYAGRPDSERKALEQATFIFLNELKTKGKGITRNKDGTYQLDYAVNSMLSAPWFWNTSRASAPERKFLENEIKAFSHLREQGFMTVQDPECPGYTFRVKFNPILFSRSFNFFTRLENWLPPFFTGQSRAQEISEEGLTQLRPIVERKLGELKKELTTLLSIETRGQIEQKIRAIETSFQALEKQLNDNHLRPEEEMLIRDFLCKQLDLPSVAHCKSSTDRTSIAIALSSALKQWLDLKLPLPEDLRELPKDWRFKELFALNWMAGHQVTRYARGGKGTVANVTLNNENLGLALSRGVFQNPSVVHLLPERYLKDFPVLQKIALTALYALLLAPLFVFLYIPLITFTALRHLAWCVTLGKNRHWIGPAKFTLPAVPFTLIFNISSLFPEKVLNESSPQVGERMLIAGGKRGGREDQEG